MSDSDKSRKSGSQDWQGFREVDRAIAENRLAAYTWKKARADPWERRALIFAGIIALGFIAYVIIYDGLI
jgi:type II secretory pathway component PulM